MGFLGLDFGIWMGWELIDEDVHGVYVMYVNADPRISTYRIQMVTL